MKCDNCGATSSENKCEYCGFENETKMEEMSSNMGKFKILKNTILKGDMNRIGYAENCVIIGDMNRIKRCKDTVVKGDMNRY